LIELVYGQGISANIALPITAGKDYKFLKKYLSEIIINIVETLIYPINLGEAHV